MFMIRVPSNHDCGLSIRSRCGTPFARRLNPFQSLLPLAHLKSEGGQARHRDAAEFLPTRDWRQSREHNRQYRGHRSLDHGGIGVRDPRHGIERTGREKSLTQ
jgi:hypothetical protein